MTSDMLHHPRHPLLSKVDAETSATPVDEADACRISSIHFVRMRHIVVESQTRDALPVAAPRVFGRLGSIKLHACAPAVHRRPNGGPAMSVPRGVHE